MKRLFVLGDKMKKIFTVIVIFVGSQLFINGCGIFTSTQRLDISPFANSMIAVAGEIQYSLLQNRSIHLSSLTPGPEYKRFVLFRKKMRDIIKATISYSIEIVTLAESKASEKDKCQALADYLEGVRRPVLDYPDIELNLTPEQMDEIIIDVRKQEKLLDAIAAAQPIIDEVAISTGELADLLKHYLDSAHLEINGQWGDKYGEVLWADNELRDGQIKAIKASYYLREYRTGRTKSTDSIFIADPQLAEVVEDKDNISKTDIMELEKRVLFKLSRLTEMRKEFVDDINLYYKGLSELESVKAAYNIALRDARNAVILWSRAHNSLGKGVTDPAEINILGLMLNAAKAAAPIPIP